LFAIPVATFGGVDRWSEDLTEVVAGAHVYPADPIGLGSTLMLFCPKHHYFTNSTIRHVHFKSKRRALITFKLFFCSVGIFIPFFCCFYFELVIL
jgi:hypothetical protein